MSKEKLPIFTSSEEFSNMRRVRFVIPQASSYEITQKVVLTEESQKIAVSKLVDRTPHWLDLEEQEQKDEIKAALLLYTVAQFLYQEDYITDDCTMYENGFDKDGNIVLDAFYVKETKLQKQVQQEFKNKRIEKEEEKKNSVFSLVDYKNKKEGKK